MQDVNDNFCECFNRKLNDMVNMLYTMTQTYRLLVGGAEEFGRIPLADKHEKVEAVERADEMGEVVDKVIKKLDHLINIQLKVCSPEIVCLVEKIQQPCETGVSPTNQP